MLSSMLSQSSITTMLPVIDVQRARAFYEGKLGFKPEGPTRDGGYLYHCAGNATIALLPKPGGTKAEHTAVSFEVDDIESTVRELEAAGVRFEDYDQPDLKTVNHIMDAGGEKCAWFRDTEGNYLCLHQELSH